MQTLTKFSSPYNRIPPSIQSLKTTDSVHIHDLTLEADAEEMAGVTISEDYKIAVAKALSQIGVDRLSILGNSPMPSEGEITSAKKLISLDLAVRLDAFVKTIEEIDLAKRIGLWGVEILVGVNDQLLTSENGRHHILEHCKSLTGYAKELDLHTCLFGGDATRTSEDFLEEIVTTLEGHYDEFTIADSAGVISPYGLQYLTERVGTWTKKPLKVHLHNHTSMATANALAAVVGGVETIQTTVNGVGELTGLVPLEEFAVASEIHLGVSTGLELSGLHELSRLVSDATGLPTNINKPVVGKDAFAIPETKEIQQYFWELHQDGKLEEAFCYPPRLVGNTFNMSIGRRCNTYTVLYNLSEKGYTADEETVTSIADTVQAELSDKYGYNLWTADELFDFCLERGFPIKPIDNS